MSVSKIVAAAASSAGGDPLDVDDVFSTFLYDGNGGTQSIVNNIDLTEGGLVWTKRRNGSSNGDHTLYDTERGTGSGGRLRSNNNQQAYSPSDAVTAFNNNGFSLGADVSINGDGYEMVSWTFRKAPNFFDVVTWTGDGTTDRSISHNLGQVPGMIIAKKTSGTGDWHVLHRSVTMSGTGNSSTGGLKLNATGGSTYYTHQWEHTYPEATLFKVAHVSGASLQTLNTSGETYVAYLFAHHNNDGEFGPGADQDIIKFGSYTGNGSSTGPSVNLGFEPQFVMIKSASGSEAWYVYDNMRGMIVGQDDAEIAWNLANEENGIQGTSKAILDVTATGFNITNDSSTVNTNNHTYIYMAIRRGPLAVPDDATKVFSVVSQAGGYQVNRKATSGFPVDFTIGKETNNSGDWYAYDRLRGGKNHLRTNQSNSEGTNSPAPVNFDNNSGIKTQLFNQSYNVVWSMFKRAKGFFDVVPYTGTGFASQSHTHSLGVVPEMIWVKDRDNASNWSIYHSAIGLSKILNFASNAFGTGNQYWGTAAHTSSVFKVGSDSDTGGSNKPYIAYLFATCPGVSKVGSYDGNGSNQNIDCGFSSGARFILIKSKQSGNWYMFDTVRGIVAGNDSHLKLDSDAVEAYADSIDTYSGGFNVVQNATTDLNKGPSDESYIFYAIA